MTLEPELADDFDAKLAHGAGRDEPGPRLQPKRPLALRAAVVIKRLLWIYAAAGAIALLSLPASAHGWLGDRAEALFTVFSLVLALPWTPLLLMTPGNSAWIGGALLAGAIGANVWAGLLVLRWCEDR